MTTHAPVSRAFRSDWRGGFGYVLLLLRQFACLFLLESGFACFPSRSLSLPLSYRYISIIYRNRCFPFPLAYSFAAVSRVLSPLPLPVGRVVANCRTETSFAAPVPPLTGAFCFFPFFSFLWLLPLHWCPRGV